MIPEPSAPDNTRTIARNSVWYGLELLSNFLGAFLVSVVVARIIGATRLGYYTYIMLLTNITVAVGAVGLPLTTRKYMAEYLNRGERGLARSIYTATFRLQSWIAAGLTAASLVLVFTIGDSTQRLISTILVLNMAPRMLGLIPSQANNAAETLARNTIPSVLGCITGLVLTLFSLWVGWGLPGVAGSLLVGTLLETLLKVHSVHKWLGAVAPVPLPPGLRKQMSVYSGQGLVLMLLNMLVWDRSDVFFLKWLNPDIQQVTFFGIAFSVVDKLLVFPNAFAASVGVTLMAQYGRGEGKLPQLTVEGGRYALLIALPLLVGLACVSGPAVLLLYGEQYRPMIPVLMVMALLAISKAVMTPAMTLLQATEYQGFLVVWGCLCGAIDIGLDILWTPRYGAVGAAWANGIAQTLAALGIWVRACQLFHLNLRLEALARIVVSCLGMALTAVIIGRAFPTAAGVGASIVFAALVWFALLRWTGAMDSTDAKRLLNIGRSLPQRVRPVWNAVLDLIAPGVA